ncbi:MAG TPA: 50S ribosomal protein L25, partial [Actinophytocola sp.]|nr:50S ribosomal protein L25 [Actinophytocola sp.]
ALTKTVTTHPIKNYIEHVDLLLVQRGEKVTVDVPIVLTGEAQPGTLVNQDATTVQVAVEALHIPEQFEVSIENAEAGTHIVASEVRLTPGAELLTDPETLIVAVNVAPTAEDMEAGVDVPEGTEPPAPAVEDEEAAEEQSSES